MRGATEGDVREKAISKYSSLFTLPSKKRCYILLWIQCMLSGIFTFTLNAPSIRGLTLGVIFGVCLFLLSYIGNHATCRWIMHGDSLLNIKRVTFLSFISNIILTVFIIIDIAISKIYGLESVSFKSSSFGLFCSLPIRILAFKSLSFLSPWRAYASSLLQPMMFLAAFLIPDLLPFRREWNIPFEIAASTLFAMLATNLLIKILNKVGIERIGIPSIVLARAFFANWMEGISKPIEEIFEHLSVKSNVKVSMIAFRSSSELKAIMVIPGIHPGPFKNVGSSYIPSMIKEALERKFRCVVSVLHGISGHELDLASQSENVKVINALLKAEFRDFKCKGSRFIHLCEEGVTVNCQVFGGFPLLIITLSPNTMEDLPIELREAIICEAKKFGFKSALPVDAHNSLSGSFDAERVKRPILEVVRSALKEASSAPTSRFKIGAASIIPSEFSIEDGMGPGGISIIVVDVEGCRTAYIAIDGNNMISGLREKILSEIRDLGIDYGEVMTTDTHAVNAVVLSSRGYHPIGEAISHERLMKYIRGCIKKAMGELEPAEASICEIEIPNVRIIGENQINNLCAVTNETLEKMKKDSLLIFPIFALALLFLLVFAI